MDVLILNRNEIRRLMPMSDCIDWMDVAMRRTAEGATMQPLRTALALPGETPGFLGWMPGHMADPHCFGAKVVSVYPENFEEGYPSHQGVVLLFEPRHGQLIGIFDGGEITAIRTAAASGLATRLLARSDASVLAILGYGEQAERHLEAMIEVRPIEAVHVWGRSLERAEQFAEIQGRERGLSITAMSSAEEAVARADIICTTTSSPEPILRGAWLRPGTHLNAVGSSIPTTREIDTEAVVRSRMYVDLRASTLAQGGEFLRAKERGAVTDAHIIGEIGEVLLGRAPGRRDSEEVTLYKSLGIVAEDLVCAHSLHERATREGVGTRIEM
jgi:ornithine cyclodeaminase